MENNNNETHEGTGITASRALWSALGFTIYSPSGMGHGPHGIERTLFAAIHATGARDERAALWAIAELERQREERTRVTAEARLAESIGQLAAALGAESAESLVRRLPDRLRPYVETVLRARQ